VDEAARKGGLKATPKDDDTFLNDEKGCLFLLNAAGVVGAVDGLVERDLRRWGGGRESSNVFNLAKKSITPAFVLACVVYISLPYSLNPVIVILPFAILLGLAVRISFERLKKYF